MIALLFPGQGKENLYLEKNEFNLSFLELTKKITGFDLTLSHLNDNVINQLKIFVSSMIQFEQYRQQHLELDFCAAGLSLGELSALCVAGVFSFEEGLDIVFHRGIFMEEACKKNEGSMMAVLGLDDESIEAFCGDGIWAANYNYNGQLVLSGYKKKLEEVKQKLLQAGARKIIPLNVDGAFHSPLMAEAKTKFGEYLDKKKFHAPKYAVYQNVSGGREYDPAVIKRNIVDHLVKPVLWKQMMLKIKQSGVNDFVDFSEREMLKKFLSRI